MRLVRVAFLALVLSASTSASAAEPSSDEPFELHVRTGGIALICKPPETGSGKPRRRSKRTIVCPAGNAMCDDVSVAIPEITPKDGMGFRGLKSGTTLCSAASNSGVGPRRVYRVVVE